jgi:precorrin-2/cobalt-factor-2 C20-methyltransferase
MWYRKQEIIKMDKQIERAGDDNKNNIGVLYGIGVGPGDPGLMTLKAINTIKACDILAIPAASKEECYAYSIVQAVLPDIENKQIMCTPFPMIKDKEKLAISHNKIYRDIVCALEAGKNVAMLTIGDPSVYSTYMYIHKRVMQAGFTAVMISGVPSFCAAAARLGISLGEMRDEIHIIPASYDVRATVGYGGTCVYMKSGKKLAELIEVLRTAADGGADTDEEADMTVYGVTNCGMESERVYRGLDELSEAKGYLTIVIVKYS